MGYKDAYCHEIHHGSGMQPDARGGWSTGDLNEIQGCDKTRIESENCRVDNNVYMWQLVD